MRIAMFTETFLPGTDGIVTRLCATLKYLQEEGHEVLLFAPAGGPETYASATVVGIKDFRFYLYPEKRFALPKRGIGKRLRAFGPDLIHVVNPAFLGLAGIYHARRMGIPLIASYHTNVPTYAKHYGLDWLEPILWWYFRTLHNRAKLNLCTSKAMVSELKKHRFRNVRVWERGVDVSLYASTPGSEAMRVRLAGGDSENRKILLYVGRLAAEKGIEKLRSALLVNPQLTLAIVGDGPHRQALEETFSDTNTVFTGYLFGTELAEAYGSADGFVFPSTTETLGLVLYESMAARLPIMAADSLPTREVLENGAAGTIFDPNRLESMQQAIHDTLYDESKRQAVRESAFQIAEGLNWAVSARQLVGYYEQVVAAKLAVPRRSYARPHN